MEYLCFKWLGWGTVTIGVLADVRDVAITYKDGGDWEREALKDALIIGASYLGSRTAIRAVAWGTTRVALCFIPGVGWVVFTLTVSAALLGDALGEKIIDYFFEKF